MEETAITVTLNQITLEVKFYLSQTAQNIIEVGKRLMQAKEMLPHGEFGKWLDSNFGLSQSTAQKFMKCAERFGNAVSIRDLNFTQMIALLSLPESETEKSIAEKAADFKPNLIRQINWLINTKSREINSNANLKTKRQW